MRPIVLLLFGSIGFAACSVELAPPERDPVGPDGGAAGVSTGGFSQGGSGAQGQDGGSSGIAGATSGGAGGLPGGSGGFGAGGAGAGGFGAGGAGAGGTGAISGGGTGNGPAQFMCANVFLIDGDLNGSPGGCDYPDPIDCYCQDCFDQCEPVPGIFSDCICPSCWNDMDICGPDVCVNDGLCDPFNEGCICPDCYLHPSCP